MDFGYPQVSGATSGSLKIDYFSRSRSPKFFKFAVFLRARCSRDAAILGVYNPRDAHVGPRASAADGRDERRFVALRRLALPQERGEKAKIDVFY